MGEELQQARAQFHTENSMVFGPFLNNQLNDPFVPLDETSSIILKETERDIHIPLGLSEAVASVTDQLTYSGIVKNIILLWLQCSWKYTLITLAPETFLPQLDLHSSFLRECFKIYIKWINVKEKDDVVRNLILLFGPW